MSPLEHQASPFSRLEFRARRAAMRAARDSITAQYEDKKFLTRERGSVLLATEQLMFSGNLRGFTQYRKQIPHEANFGELRAD